MDKVIIIDGVDVSECKYNEKESCHIYAYSCDADDFCTDNKNCYYKQLKRLEQANERIKKELKDYKVSKENSYQNLQKEWQQCQWDIRQLTTENERLKKEVETWNYQADKRAELSNIWFNTAETYKQALQEIRDIALIGEHCEGVGCDFMPKILTKINEVIGE